MLIFIARKTGFLALALLFALPSFGGVYKCQAPSGQISYSGVPCGNDQAEVGHQVREEVADPAGRKSAPAPRKSGPPSSPVGAGPKSSLESDMSSLDDKMCNGFKRRYEEAQRLKCIQAVQEGTGKVMCMPEAHRAAFISNLRELVAQNCR